MTGPDVGYNLTQLLLVVTPIQVLRPMVNPTDLLFFLRQERVVDPAYAEHLAALAKDFPEAKNLLRELARRGWITTYQANQLFQDRGKELILGSYVILERLGEGGMGTVYKSRHRKLQRIVALKVIRSDRLARPDVVRRFQREIRAAAQLDHPHIVHAIDADEVNGTHFLVMEYIEGGIDLSRLVKSKGPLPVKTACEYMRQAALGLQHAFERNLIHRDIKPQNLIVVSGQWAVDSEIGTGKSEAPGTGHGQQALFTAHCPLPTLKILDLGLARFDDSATIEQSSTDLTKTGVIMGTLDYMAPEQTRDSHQVDIRADLYSLGCTFYYLLTGKVPFPGSDPMAKLMKHRLDQPKAVEALRPNVPSRVTDIVYRLMAKEPKDRYQTPAELAQALEDLQRPAAGGTAIVKNTPSQAVSSESVFSQLLSSDAMLLKTPKPATSNPRKRLLMASLAGTSLLILMLIILLGPWNQSSRPDRQKSAKNDKVKEQKPERELTWDDLEKVKQREEAEREKKRQAKSQAAFKKLCQEATKALKPLTARFGDPKTGGEALRNDLLAFRVKYSGTPAGLQAIKLVMKLPSPLDKLDAAKIPEAERWPGQPKELLAVLGSQQRRHWGAVQFIAFAADQSTVISVGTDGWRLWNIETNQAQWVKPSTTPKIDIWSLGAISPDRTRLAVLTGIYNSAGIRILDLRTGKEALVLEKSNHDQVGTNMSTVSFSPDGRFLVAVYYGNMGQPDKDNVYENGWTHVDIWDASTGKKRKSYRITIGWPSFAAAALAADNKTLAVAIERRRDQKGTGTSKLETVFMVVETGNAKNLRGTVARQNDGNLFINWEKKQPMELAPYAGDGQITMSSDDKKMATGSGKLVELPTGKLRFTLPVSGVSAFSRDGKRVAYGGGNGTVRLFDTMSGKEVRGLVGPIGPINRVQFTPDCTQLLAAGADGTARIWDPGSGLPTKSFPGHHAWIVPNGKGFLTANADGILRLHDMQGKVVCDLGNGGPYAAISPNGRLALASGPGGKILMLDLVEGKQVDEFVVPQGSLFSIDIASDGRRAVSGDGGQNIALWDLQERKELERVNAAFGSVIYSTQFSPDGQRVYFSSHRVGWWDLQSRNASEIKIIQQRQGRANYSIRLSPSGTLIAIARAVGLLEVRDLATNRKILQTQLPGPIHCLSFASDGRHLATANNNGTVYILRLRNKVP